MEKAAEKPIKQYLTIEDAYDLANQRLFAGELPGVMITLEPKNKAMGFFSPKRYLSPENKWFDQISINPEFFHESEEASLCTLVHESCHQWQEHFGTPSRTGYHNKEWADKMEAIGLMPSSTGAPGGKKTGQRMSDYPIEGPFADYVQEIRSRFPSGVFSWRIRTIQDMEIKEIDDEGTTRYQTEENLPKGIITAPSGHIYEVIPSPDGKGSIITPLDNSLSSQVVTEDIRQIRQKKKKGGKRTTYQCPECQSRIWGKAGLKVRCEECQKIFQEVV